MRTGWSSRLLATLALSGVLVLMLVAPAAAKRDGHGAYTWTDAGSYECGSGTWVDWSAGGSGILSVRAGTGDQAGVYFAHDTFQWHATDVRRSDGLTIHFAGRGNTRETKATHVSGTLYEVTSIDAGTLVVTDDEGNVIARDRGSIRETILFDTLGDDDPDGELINSISVRVNGPHSDFESCSVFGD